jgi:hypothetical protein
MSYHLGCDFFSDQEGYAPLKYIKKLVDNYVRLFGTKSKQATPLVKNDHPELDTSPFFDLEKISIYQSLVGAIQWVVQIGALTSELELAILCN